MKSGEPRARACPLSTCMCQWSAHSLPKNDSCVGITVSVGHTLENPAPIDNLGVILHGSHFCRTPAPNPLHQGWLWGRDVGALGPLREPVSGGGASWRHCLNQTAGFSKVPPTKMLTRAHAHREFRLWGQTRSRDFNFNTDPAQRNQEQHDSRADPRMEDQLVKLGEPQARACVETPTST